MGFDSELGFRLAADGSTVELEPGAEHEVAPGTIHFAVLATLGEVAAARAAAAPVVPTHVAVQLVQRATPDSTIQARGRVLRSGRTLIFAEGEVSQGGQLVAKVSATFARLG
jgi:acyl-coenzyme A thioesterase PaaI-like protein